MRSTRRHLALALAVPTAVALSVLTACAPGGGGGGGSTDGEDTLTLGMTADLPGLSVLIQPSYQGWFADAVWDSLLICDEFGKPSPQLATEWEYNDDQSAATLTLREGVKFSDGSEFDAADVEAALTAAGEVNERFADLTFESPDPQTITVTWPQPIPTMDLILCEPNISSAEAYEGNLDTTVVGSGPYIYDADASTQGSTYALKKNPDYWDSDTYPFENLELKVFTDNTAGLNALKTGQIEGILADASTVEEAQKSGKEIVTLRGVTTRLLVTDHNGEMIPALGDVRVRHAMNMVFDRDAIAEDLYRGYADPAYQIFRPGSTAYLEDLTEDPYPYDVEAAKALMEEAGFADGFTLQIPFFEGQGHDLLFPYVTEQLGQLNITVEQVTLTGPDAITELLSGKYPVPLWQLGNYGESLQDIKDYILTDGIWNVSHQPDATIDALWQTILTGTDEEKVAAQQEINQYVIDQAWFVPMAYPDGFYAYSPDISIPTMSDFSALHPLLRDFQK